MFTYMQLRNLLLGGFSETFFTQILKHSLWNHKHIYMTNKLVTITQSCAYLYSAGTQHRNLLKLLVMMSMVICHQNIKGHMNTELKYTNKCHWSFWKTHIYFNHSATIYTRLIWFQVTTKETCALKWLHPSFLKSQMWLMFTAVHSRYGCHYLKDILGTLTRGEDEGLKSLPCHTCCRTRVSWYTSTGVG